jgi:hypothetical protein
MDRTMVYKAVKLDNGKVVCVDVEQLHQTTKVVNNQREYDIALGQGWSVGPQQAMDRFEAEECELGEAAALRAYEDQHMSPAAQAEAAQVDATTVRHLAEIPVAPKRGRGRPKKVQ